MLLPGNKGNYEAGPHNFRRIWDWGQHVVQVARANAYVECPSNFSANLKGAP